MECGGYEILPVNIGKIHLTLPVKIGYNISMLGDIISFILRILLVVALWLFVWRFVEPRTQLMRVFRATLLVLFLLAVLVVLRVSGTN